MICEAYRAVAGWLYQGLWQYLPFVIKESRRMGTEIPGPSGWPVIGNILDLLATDFHSRMRSQYGSIYKVSWGMGSPSRIHVCSAELLNEICDEKRFIKNNTDGGLYEVRNLTHDGLFTALHGEENWGLAHRILMPVLSPMSIGGMFEGATHYSDMHEVASQLMLKWARFGSNAKIAVTEDFTRLTLDTLALCTMDTRFNSFYSETPHAFVDAMNSFLKESGLRALRPALLTDYVYRKQTQKYFEDIELMRDIARSVVQRRRASSARKRDLVDAMIYEKDPVTDKNLPEESVIDNMITFLIAGHETTSGMLSFLLYLLVKNPDAMRKAREEVDSVLGDGVMTLDMMSKLPYVTAVIRETLRLHPTAPGFTVRPKSTKAEDYPILIGRDKYAIHQEDAIIATLGQVHRDPVVYGDDAEEFRPERMLDEQFNKLPKNSWKPFGNGARGCIGRAFALQESTIVVALLLQNFDFMLHDPDYQLIVKKALTIKPKDFYVRASLREGLSPSILQRRLLSGERSKSPSISSPVQRFSQPRPSSKAYLQDLLVCYGSNTGSCQTLAHTLAKEAPFHGFKCQVISMDQAIDRISPRMPVIAITASYEGEPPDNATRFVKWLQCLTDSPFDGCYHAVYGCGNRDWVDTFQRIPTVVDDAFVRHGSTGLVARGISDAANSNIFNEFDEWADRYLWPALVKRFGTVKGEDSSDRRMDFEVIQSSRRNGMLQDGGHGIVRDVRILTSPGEPQKGHIEIQLPHNMTYTTGDYLAILPVNPDSTVKEVMTRFGLPIDARIQVKNGSKDGLNGIGSVSVHTFLREYVGLNQVATEKNMREILQSIPGQSQREEFERISTMMVLEQQLSPLDLLQMFPTSTLPISEYLAMLPLLHARQYSISSSPRVDTSTCTLTYSVLSHKKTRLDGSESLVLGAASNYLASLRPNDRVWVSVRPSHAAFHLPEHPAEVPIVMACAGSGLAPFRAFVQERMMLIEEGIKVAQATLFIGCRHPDRDALYADELREWEAKGAVELKYAFSRDSDQSEGCKYVQDVVWKYRKRLSPMIQGSGKMFVCGDARVVEGVSDVVVKAYAEEKGASMEEAQVWFRGVRNELFVSDVFN